MNSSKTQERERERERERESERLITSTGVLDIDIYREMSPYIDSLVSGSKATF